MDANTRVRPDHTVVPASARSCRHYPDPLRRIHCHHAEQNRSLRFLTNNFAYPRLPSVIFTSRWQVELFFA
jgi:hypothetical protein